MALLALQAWTENREWSLPDPGSQLQERFDEVAAAHEVDPVRVPQGVITRARLKTRAKELAAILADVSANVRSELLLRDESNHLFGILDIAGTGPAGFILDFKTGRNASADLSPAIEHQMVFYAHLFQATNGTLPKHVIVFSLQRGPAEIEVTPSAIAALLDQIRAAKLTERTAARPDANTCRFCPKRMVCQPHWDAVLSWERADAIEGTINNVEHSSTGTAALLIGGEWLTGIPKGALQSGTVPGMFARAVRVRRRNDSALEEWAADGTTHIRIAPAR